MLCKHKCYGDLVFSAEFSPTEKNLIVTCGKQHIAFWNLDGHHLSKKMGVFENSSMAGCAIKIEKPKYILCCK
jgi:microtubule-associated protein-like 1/2